MFESGDTWSKRASEVFYQNLGRFSEAHVYDDEPAKIVEAIQDRIHVAEEWRSKCESPIEEIMAAILPFVCHGYGYPEDSGWEDAHGYPGNGIEICPQVEFEEYRVDFMVKAYCKGHTRRLVIECDGHDFHERTKQQAARDRSRDRKMVAAKVNVLRYTGFELYRDPDAIGAELERVFFELIEDTMTDAGMFPFRVGRVA